jgi:probable HAF family extracellular repeat protein
VSSIPCGFLISRVLPNAALASIVFLAVAGSQVQATPAYEVINLTDFGLPKGGARAINDAGQVVVGYSSEISSIYQDESYVFWEDRLYRLGHLDAYGIYAYGYHNNVSPQYAINASGRVTGNSYGPSPNPTTDHATLVFPNFASPGADANPWFESNLSTPGYFADNLLMTDIHPASSYDASGGRGLNDAGAVTGWVRDDATYDLAVFLKYPGQTAEVEDLSGFLDGEGGNPYGYNPIGLDINNSNQIVGEYTGGARYRSFYWADDGDGLAEVGEVIPDIGHLGGGDTRVADINNLGQAIGSSTLELSNFNDYHAFLWQDDGSPSGSMIDLGTLDEDIDQSSAYGLNDKGTVVGLSNTTAGLYQAFIYKDGEMTNLNDVVELPANNKLQVANAVNNMGWIVGNACTDSGCSSQYPFLAKPTGADPDFALSPDPSSPSEGPFTVTVELGAAGPGIDEFAFVETPVIANLTGYTFNVAPADPNFLKIIIPDNYLQDILFEIVFDGVSDALLAGNEYLFPAGGVSQFTFTGIDVDPSDPASFPVGVWFVHNSEPLITMTPLTNGSVEPPGPTPTNVPPTLALVVFAVIPLVRQHRRMGKKSE